MTHLSALLAAVHGAQLTGVSASYLTMPGAAQSETPHSVWLVFRHAGALRLTTASNGESILCDTALPGDDDMADMGEYGRLDVVDVSSRPPWDFCCGQRLTAVNKLVRDGSDIGVDLVFGTARALVFNWGDTLYVRATLDAPFLQAERIERVQIEVEDGSTL